MRTRTPTERARMSAAGVNHHLKVEVENADRTYQDLTNLQGIDWVAGATFGESIDQPTGTATIQFRRDTTSPINMSAAPLIGASLLNRDNAGAYAPLLYPGRNLRISAAVTARGVAPVAGDWKPMGIWRIDNVKWNSDPVEVQCRDAGGWLVDRYIEDERAYATDAPTAIETVMGQLLTDWPTYGAPTLYTPASPGWMLNNTEPNDDGSVGKAQERKALLEALQQDYALSIGWLCRFRFDASDNYRLTFFDADRTRTAPDDTFGPTEYRDITSLEIDDADVRNRIRGIWIDRDGVPHPRTVENLASQAEHGVRFMEMKFTAKDPIDSDEEMDALLGAAVSDLGAPFATQEMETLFYWPVQLGDLHLFEANGDHYDDDQTLAVVSYTHRFANGEAWTTMQCRGNVIGAYHAWFRWENTDGSTAGGPPALIRRVSETESEDGTTRDFRVLLNAAVDALYVHYRTVPINVHGDPFDFSDDGDVDELTQTLVLRRPDDGSAVTFSVPHPSRGYEIAGRMVPFTADLIEGVNYPFGVDATPPAINAKLKAERQGDVGSIAVDVTFGQSDGPVTVEVFERVGDVVTSIYTTRLTQPTFIVVAELTNRPLPPGKDSLEWRVIVTDVSGQEYGFGPASVNRDPLPNGTVVLRNFRPHPDIVCSFDPDTDGIRYTSADGRVKTFTAADLWAAGSPVTITAGVTPFDDATLELVLLVDETRAGALIEYLGGGQWIEMWRGDLHGQPSNPPTLTMRAVKSSDGATEDAYVTVKSPVGELLAVFFRDGDTDIAPLYRLCAGAADPTQRFVASGTEIGPADYFMLADGTGTPTQRLNDIVVRDLQVKRVAFGAAGKESGVEAWVPWDMVMANVSVAQGTVSIDANGVWSASVDLPANAQSCRYGTIAGGSISGYPNDATTAASGTVVSGRTFSVNNGGTLLFGQTIWITIVPFTGTGGGGTQLPAIHIRGSYLTYSASKTLTFPAASTMPITNTPWEFSYDTNGFLNGIGPGGGPGTLNEFRQFFGGVPGGTTGVTITQIAVTVYEDSNSGGLDLFFCRTQGSTTTVLGSASAAFGGGWQTLTISMSESTNNRGYHLDLQFWSNIALGDSKYASTSITYSMPDPKQTA